MKRLLPLLAACAALLMLGGCSALPTISNPFRRPAPRPGRTSLGSKLVTVPTKAVGNYLIVEMKSDRPSAPYHFLIDTGSSVTLVTPAFAKRFASKNGLPADLPPFRVAGANGQTTDLAPITIGQFTLGDARFEDVFALIYDCDAFSAHLGVKIDGVLGFSLFRETLLTLDYPHGRVLLQSPRTQALIPGTAIPLNDTSKTPLISVHLGDRSIVALIDSGSDASFSLNPIGLNPVFVSPPRSGTTVGTLTGVHAQQVARLDDTLLIGDYTLPRPLVDLSDELSAIGGAILKNFSITFDQEHDRVHFQRDTHDAIASPPRRTTGLSFSKTPAYWRIAGVITNSPADEAEIKPGDLLTYINGEPVANWSLNRYEQLVATTDEIAFRFLNGVKEIEKDVRVFNLVP